MIRKALIIALLFAATAQPTNLDMLLIRMNRFATAYNDFVIAFHNGVFSYSEAKRLSKLWAAIEKSRMWPRPKGDRK